MVAQQDEEFHKMLRKPFASIYSARGVEVMEPLISDPIQLFQEQLRRCALSQENVDLGFWIQLCVWDVLCNVMFSKTFGFLESGQDVGNMLRMIWKQFQEGAPVSKPPLMPPMDPFSKYSIPAHKSVKVVHTTEREMADQVG